MDLGSIGREALQVQILSRAPLMTPTAPKPILFGETLASLTERLAARGEPAFRAKQILEWVYKKRVRDPAADDQPPRARCAPGSPRLSTLDPGQICPHQNLLRRDGQAPARTARRLADRNRRHPRADGRRGRRALAQNHLHFHPGRLRLWLPLLRLRPRRLEARPRRRRNRRPTPRTSASQEDATHPPRPRGTGLVRQHRRHGHGRTARQLRQPAARARRSSTPSGACASARGA